MNNTKHTPGPWFVSRNSNYVRAESSKGWNIATIEDQPPYKEANAKLMAAAPELLKALNSLVLSVMAHPDYTGDENEEWTDLIETAEEAIKKATT